MLLGDGQWGLPRLPRLFMCRAQPKDAIVDEKGFRERRLRYNYDADADSLIWTLAISSKTPGSKRARSCRAFLSVLIWSRRIRPRLPPNVSGIRKGAGLLPVVIGATITVRR